MQSKLPCCAQLCCVPLLPVLRSDRQYGVICVGEKTGGRERSNTYEVLQKKKKEEEHDCSSKKTPLFFTRLVVISILEGLMLHVECNPVYR